MRVGERGDKGKWEMGMGKVRGGKKGKGGGE